MNSRVTNPESYIFSAIIYIGKDNFTSNDVAKILIERFSFQKTFLRQKLLLITRFNVWLEMDY